jgi:hypothetical protein
MLKELFTELVLNMKNRISDQQWVYQWYGNDFWFRIANNRDFFECKFWFRTGKRDLKADLVQENYANLSVSFSLNDKWFEKRKFN